MSGIQFIIGMLFIIVALISVTVAVLRAIRRNKNWRVMEPEVIAKIEESTEQKVVYSLMLNANDSTDFSHGKGFWLWLGFTAEYIAFADRDRLAGKGTGYLYLSRRRDTSMKRLEKNFAELEFRDKDSSERMKFTVLVRSSDREVLSAFIPNRG